MNHQNIYLERRMKALRELPWWFLPAETVLRVTDSDLDRLAAASWSEDAYRWVLRQIVSRIEADQDGNKAA